MAVALEESRAKPHEWHRIAGDHPYSTAAAYADLVRSIQRRGNLERLLRGFVIEPGEAWDARVVVAPGGPLNECTVWVMYLGSPDPSH